MANAYTHGSAAAGRSQTALLLLLAALASGPAAASSDKHKDPFERVNRAIYAFNDAVDRMAARPAARAYVAVVPGPARQAISHLLENLEYPKVIINDALQGKFKDAGSDTVRLVINTTLGIGGLFDRATKMGFESHDEDFGQTLGHWGVPPGPFLVIPLLGLSDLRDAPSKFLIDRYMLPETYAKSTKITYGVTLVRLLDRRVELLGTDATVENAFDRYVFIRDAYLARRNYLVHDGNVPDENYDLPVDAPSDKPSDAQPESPPEAPATPPSGQADAAPPH